MTKQSPKAETTETIMVHEHIDTVDALMAHYVAGSLPEPARVLVESHLEMKPDHRMLVQDLELLAGQALEQTPETKIADRNARFLAKIFASAPPTANTSAPAKTGKSVFPRAIRSLDRRRCRYRAMEDQASRLQGVFRSISTAARSV
jgi:putative transcriptional regulator